MLPPDELNEQARVLPVGERRRCASVMLIVARFTRMQQDQPPIKESASNRLAAALRDGLLALAVFALVVWFLYNGLTGIVTRHLDSNNEIGVRWIPEPLNGWRAVVAGCSFVCMALAILSVLASHRRIAGRVPHWVHASKWWLVPMWAILYFVTAL